MPLSAVQTLVHAGFAIVGIIRPIGAGELLGHPRAVGAVIARWARAPRARLPARTVLPLWANGALRGVVQIRAGCVGARGARELGRGAGSCIE